MTTLTGRGLRDMAVDVGTQEGPGATTRAFNEALIAAFRANGGVVPGELAQTNFLLLTTTGAKSGRPRVTPLVYHRIDGRWLVVASTGGGPRNPAWFDNLVREPQVSVEEGTRTWRARARVLDGADRESVFAEVVRTVPTFGRYQSRTERVIPVVEFVREA